MDIWGWKVELLQLSNPLLFLNKPGTVSEGEGGIQGSGLNTARGLSLGPAVPAWAVGDQDTPTHPRPAAFPPCPVPYLLAEYGALRGQP